MPDVRNDADVKYIAEISIGGVPEKHSKLYERDLPDQHPMSAISGLEDSLDEKVEKTTSPKVVYGTDENGEQTTYDVDTFGGGLVNDVKVGGVSVVTNKIAELGTMALENEVDYSTKAVADTLYAEKSYETTIDNHVANKNNPHSVNKNQIGLGSVDNTSDANKPISIATQAALDNKQPKSTTAYSLGNASGGWTALTSDQQSAINSGATTAKINQIATNQTDITNIKAVIPATATSTNKLVDKSYVDDLQDQIDTINTSLGGYGDIVTHDADEFATAAQGAKADTALQPGDNVSELVNDSGYITSTDISHLATKAELTTGLGTKQNTLVSGTDIKTINNIPLLGSGNITVGGTVESVNAKTGAVVLTYSDVDALSEDTKYAHSLDVEFDEDTDKLTITLKDQDGTTLSSKHVDLALESVVMSGTYDSTNKKIVLTLKGGSTVDIPVGDLVNGLQAEITSTNKLNADLVDDSTSTNKFVTSVEKTTWNNKQDAITDLATIRAGATAGSTALQAGDNVSDLTNDAGYITSADLSNYTTETYVDTELDKKQDKLVSGTTLKTVNNHSLLGSGNIDTEYTAGTGISITSRAISVDNTVAKKSEIPTNNNQLTNGAGYITGITSGDVTTALGFTPANSANLGTMAAESASDYTKTSGLATVATSGSYNDLANKPTIPAAQVNSDWNATSGVAQILNKPTIPTVDQTYSATSANAQSGVAVASAISNKADKATTLAGYGITDGADTDLSNLNAAGKAAAAHFPMPSNKNVTLTLGASGTQYTAPANGWFVFAIKSKGTVKLTYIMASQIEGSRTGVGYRDSSYLADTLAEYTNNVSIPVRKGAVVVVDYDVAATVILRVAKFVYAEGDK